MLQSIRDNSQGIVAKVIVGLIIVTFALFGVESLVSLTNGSNAPATVNGEEISEHELYQQVELQRRQLLARMGENADPALLQDDLIQQAVLENLIEQEVLIQSATNQNMIISEQMIDQELVSTKDFQLDGRFDRGQFTAVLASAGFTPLSYRALLAKDKLISQERSGYQLSAFMLPNEVDQLVELDRQTRDISYFVLPADPVRASVAVSDDQVAAAYDARKASLKTQEQLVVDYLVLDRSAIVDEVDATESDLKQRYDSMVSSFKADELRGASHILVEVSEEVSDQQALDKIQSIQQRLTAGEKFADLAAEASDDIGSAESGGQLGLNERGVFVGPFEDALYALSQIGDVSEPVRTEFGYHIIKLDDIQQQEVPSYDESVAKLTEEIKAEKAEEIFVDRYKQLEDISFSSGDLIEPAEVLGLEIQTSKPFSRDRGEDIFANPRIVNLAFSDEVLKERVNSEVVELENGLAVVINVQEHLLPRLKTLDEVAAELKDELLTEAVAKQLQSDAEKAVASLEGGADLSAVSGTHPLINLDGLDRSATQLPLELRADVFKMPVPKESTTYKWFELSDGSFAVVGLKGVHKGDVAELQDDQRKLMMRIIAGGQGQSDYQSVVASSKAAAEIERL